LCLVLSRIPGLNLLRVPSRAWFIVGLGVCWLAVRGAGALEAGWRMGGRRANLISAGVLTALWLLAIGGSLVARKPLANLLITAAAATGVLLGMRVRLAPLVLALLTALELMVVNSTLIVPRPAPPGALAEWLSRQPGVWRVYSPSYSLPQLDAARYGLEQADGVNPLQLSGTVAYMDAASGVAHEGYNVTVPPFAGDVATSNQGAPLDADLLGRLNVRYVVSEFDILAEGLELETQIGSTRVYENTRDMGRVRGGTLVSRSPNRIVVSTDGPGPVILAEVWYPGWVATLDGVPAAITRDGIFRSVTAGAGPHELVFEFRPATLAVGGALSLLASLAAAAGLSRRA
jgi:hypothetical protein